MLAYDCWFSKSHLADIPVCLQFLQQYRHYQSNVHIFKLQPDKSNKEMQDLVMFLAQVTLHLMYSTVLLAIYLIAKRTFITF